MGWEELVEQLRQDKVSGAVEIAKKAAWILKVALEEGKAASASELAEQLARAGKAVMGCQPSMSSLFNLVNTALRHSESKEAVQQALDDFVQHLDEGSAAVVRNALPLIPDGGTVMTHSFSSTVLNALLQAKQEGKKFEVICTESRPQREGVALSLKLGFAGIKTRLVADAVAPSMVGQAQVVIVGSDSICSEGVVNKAGTYAIAVAAKPKDVPVFALADTTKFLPARFASNVIIEWKEPEEILFEDNPPPQVQVINVYFDTTPWELVSGIVTEEGLLNPQEAQRRLKDLEVHPLLLGG